MIRAQEFVTVPAIAAFLDALSIGETGDPHLNLVRDDDHAYATLCGGGHFGALDQHGRLLGSWPAGFPRWPGIIAGGVMSHAAGRYQFEPQTWAQLALTYGPKYRETITFAPAWQDRLAWINARDSYRRLTESAEGGPFALLDDLSDPDNLDFIAQTLQQQWTSLGDAFAGRYASCLSSYARAAA